MSKKLTRDEAKERVQSALYLLYDYVDECATNEDRMVMLGVVREELKLMQPAPSEARNTLNEWLRDASPEHRVMMEYDNAGAADYMEKLAAEIEADGEYLMDAVQCREIATQLRAADF